MLKVTTGVLVVLLGLVLLGFDSGRLAYAETDARHWQAFTKSVSIVIAEEVEGRAPRAKNASWTDYWQSRIDTIEREYGDDRDKYIEYIIYKRRELSLPEI